MILRSVLGLFVPTVCYLRWRRGLGDAVADHAAYWRRRARRPGEFVLVALGDSLAQGLTASRPELGFVGLLADRLERDRGCSVSVRNLSVSGATVAEVLADQLPRLDELPTPDLVVVCAGTNDVSRTEPEQFRDDLHGLCAALAGRAPRVLVADVPEFARGPLRVRARRYSEISREVLADHPTLTKVELQRTTEDQRSWELGRDLTHPGNAGHRRYLAAFDS